MCARLSQILPPEAMEKLFSVHIASNLEPRYNVAPSQDVLAVRRDGERAALAPLRWGLVPAWAGDARIGNQTINARAETLAQKPAFRAAFQSRRCLIPADGFYEWDKSVKARPAYRFVMEDGSLMALAGLWEHNEALDLTTFTIVTCAANGQLEAIGHNRMPVLIAQDAQDAWLAPDSTADDLADVMQPCPAGRISRFMVSDRINSPKNDDPACIEPVDGPAQADLFE